MMPLNLAALVLNLTWTLFARLTLKPEAQRQRQDRCWGHGLEILAYADYPRAMLGSLLDLTLASGRLFVLMLRPGLPWLILLFLVVSWLSPVCRLRPPRVGEAFLVRGTGDLKGTADLVVETQPLVDGGVNYWRVRASRAGWHELGSFRVLAGDGWLWQPPPAEVLYPPRQLWLGDRLWSWESLFLLYLVGWAVIWWALRKLVSWARF